MGSPLLKSKGSGEMGSPLRRQSALASVDVAILWWGRESRQRLLARVGDCVDGNCIR